MKTLRISSSLVLMLALGAARLVAQPAPAPPVPPVPPVAPIGLSEQAREQMREVSRQAAELGREQARIAREMTRDLSRSNDEYRSGQNAIDRRDYDQAIRHFDRVIAGKTRADGALYWKAYSLNKLGRKADAQTALADLEKQFPQSRWLNDARSLAAEVRASNGQPASPESQADEELKLLAMNSLMQQDSDRAIPLLEKVLADPKSSPAIKGRVIFVLAQSKAPRARQIVLQYAKTGTNPDAQWRALEYIGTFRSDEGIQALGEAYTTASDPALKRIILRGLMVSRAKDRLVQVAKTETDVSLRQDAIRYLAGLKAESELASLYKTESNTELKKSIIQALAGEQAGKELVDLVKSETNPDLKREIVRALTNIRSKEGADYLEELIKK